MTQQPVRPAIRSIESTRALAMQKKREADAIIYRCDRALKAAQADATAQNQCAAEQVAAQLAADNLAAHNAFTGVLETANGMAQMALAQCLAGP